VVIVSSAVVLQHAVVTDQSAASYCYCHCYSAQHMPSAAAAVAAAVTARVQLVEQLNAVLVGQPIVYIMMIQAHKKT
jgi:hypothetical protein